MADYTSYNKKVKCRKFPVKNLVGIGYGDKTKRLFFFNKPHKKSRLFLSSLASTLTRPQDISQPGGRFPMQIQSYY